MAVVWNGAQTIECNGRTRPIQNKKFSKKEEKFSTVLGWGARRMAQTTGAPPFEYANQQTLKKKRMWASR